jgi:hypothetical protein
MNLAEGPTIRGRGMKDGRLHRTSATEWPIATDLRCRLMIVSLL